MALLGEVPGAHDYLIDTSFFSFVSFQLQLRFAPERKGSYIRGTSSSLVGSPIISALVASRRPSVRRTRTTLLGGYLQENSSRATQSSASCAWILGESRRTEPRNWPQRSPKSSNSASTLSRNASIPSNLKCKRYAHSLPLVVVVVQLTRNVSFPLPYLLSIRTKT